MALLRDGTASAAFEADLSAGGVVLAEIFTSDCVICKRIEPMVAALEATGRFPFGRRKVGTRHEFIPACLGPSPRELLTLAARRYEEARAWSRRPASGDLAARRRGEAAAAERTLIAAIRAVGLGNVFVRVSKGITRSYPAPNAPATVDQSVCMYRPRVQGIVAGQTLEIKNSNHFKIILSASTTDSEVSRAILAFIRGHAAR